MDIEYWNHFYQNNSRCSNITNPSTFAEFCSDNFLHESKNIVDIGCGNARDAIYFAHKHHTVYALDQSIDNYILESSNNLPGLKLIKTDFVYDQYDFCKNIDIFYSRFSIHSISIEGEEYLLPRIYSNLRPGGLFCIEARTTNDPKFGIGDHICNTTYFNDGHSRRFIDTQQFIQKVLSLGFSLKYFNEQNNLSIYKDDNPVLMRIILEK